MIHRFLATVGDHEHEIAVEQVEGGAYRVTLGGRTRLVEARRVEGDTWQIVPAGGGRVSLVEVDGTAPDLQLGVGGHALAVKIVEAREAKLAGIASPRHAGGPQPVRSPMPGKVVKLLVQAGEEVKAGQGVVVVEAMKMENELRAPRDGKVVELSAAEGATVESGQTLALIG